MKPLSPKTLERKYAELGLSKAKIDLLRTSVEEANMKDGKVDVDSLEAIAFDPYTHGYYKVGGRVGDAFKDGLKLK